MAVLGELLFYRRDQVDLDTVLRAQGENLRKKIDGLPDQQFLDRTDEEIAHDLAVSEAIEPLTVEFDKAEAAVSEVQIEDHDRFGFERGPMRVAGLRAMKTIPFTGDGDLWWLRTNPLT